MRQKLAAGNWKMNGTGGDLHVLTELAQRHTHPACELLICPPATLLHRAAQAVEGAEIAVGGQDCHPQGNGAYTGDISAQMLIDAGASAVILGHSERRQYHAEADETVCAKALAAQAAGLTVIVCVGESLAQREAAETLQVIAGQIAGSVPDLASGNALVIAYEPIWAIGTGLVPDTGQIAEVHDFMRTRLQDRFGAEIGGQIRLLYGGSVKATNAEEIFAVPNVDGALVGGASLTAADFSPIVRALESST